jgi:hypothetical protein
MSLAELRRLGLRLAFAVPLRILRGPEKYGAHVKLKDDRTFDAFSGDPWRPVLG